MDTKGRALYNFIRLSWQEDSSLFVEPWQVEDYRILGEPAIFVRLKNLGIPLERSVFLSYAQDFSSPEELTEALWVKEGIEGFDQAYLLVFELWRRFLLDKKSISIFCDQLDYLIDLYDQELTDPEELVDQIQESLLELEQILDEHVDQGEDPKKILEEISLFCAHDLENFIFDFASDEMDRDHFTGASEVIDGFSSYVEDQRWLSFLQLRLIDQTDPGEAESGLFGLLEDLNEEPHFELLLEIARFLVHRGSTKLFIKTLLQAQNQIETEQDFQELLAITCQFHRLLDQDVEVKAVEEILASRKNRPLAQEIASKDPQLMAFFQRVKDLDWSEA